MNCTFYRAPLVYKHAHIQQNKTADDSIIISRSQTYIARDYTHIYSMYKFLKKIKKKQIFYVWFYVYCVHIKKIEEYSS